MADSRNDLFDLKNLGVSSINILKAIGISSRFDLERVGPVKAYCKIIRRPDISTSKVMLYALEGALQDLEWKLLDEEVKKRLVAEVEAMLEQEAES